MSTVNTNFGQSVYNNFYTASKDKPSKLFFTSFFKEIAQMYYVKAALGGLSENHYVKALQEISCIKSAIKIFNSKISLIDLTFYVILRSFLWVFQPLFWTILGKKKSTLLYLEFDKTLTQKPPEATFDVSDETIIKFLALSSKGPIRLPQNFMSFINDQASESGPMQESKQAIRQISQEVDQEVQEKQKLIGSMSKEFREMTNEPENEISGNQKMRKIKKFIEDSYKAYYPSYIEEETNETADRREMQSKKGERIKGAFKISENALSNEQCYFLIEQKKSALILLGALKIERNKDISLIQQALEIAEKYIIEEKAKANPSDSSIKKLDPKQYLAAYVFDKAYVNASNAEKDKIIRELNGNNNPEILSVGERIQLVISTVFSYPPTRLVLFYMGSRLGLKAYQIIYTQLLPRVFVALPITFQSILKKIIGVYQSTALSIKYRLEESSFIVSKLVFSLLKLFIVDFPKIFPEIFLERLPVGFINWLTDYPSFSIPLTPISSLVSNPFNSKRPWIETFNEVQNLIFQERGITSSLNPWDHQKYILEGARARKIWLQNFVAS